MLDTFAEAMTDNSAKEQTQEYQPEDDEIKESLAQAKKLNSKIFKETHPEEFKRKQQQIKDKKLQEQKYAEKAKDKMKSLTEEVQDQINDFIETAQDI